MADVWDDSVAPGGFVCGTCGVPTESEPCAEHGAPENVQLPTLPGKAAGIVGMDPLVVQCRECGTTYTGSRRSVAADIILSGFHFHTCEGRDGKRRCPDCLAAAEAACLNRGRHQ